ncbi:MAG: hypothetical protein RSG23_05085 [Gordonibacter sp.]
MRATNLTITMISLTDLLGYEKNSKIHTRENIDAIKASIGSFGMCDPLKVWKNATGGGVVHHCRGPRHEAGPRGAGV